MEIEIISEPAKLKAFCVHAATQEWLSVDTEFMREDSFYPKLCLVQVATQIRIACIDALALDDLSALYELLGSKALTKVFHAARQDLEILYLLSNTVPAPVFDTQVAASALGYGHQVSYAYLVLKMCGVQLDKSLSRKIWTRRPLPDRAIRYAANDVRYLSPIYKSLRLELAEKDRTHWVDNECQRLCHARQYKPDPDNSWKSVKGARKLLPVQLVVLKALASWRDRTAMTRDRPRQWIMRDEALCELAVKQPASVSSLMEIKTLTRKQRDRYAHSLLGCVEAARQTPEKDWPLSLRHLVLSRSQRKNLKLASQFVQERAKQLHVQPDFLASRAMLVKLINGLEAPHAVLGWRHNLIGKELEQILGEE